jgi:predicted aconitase with swiveling domain
MLQIATGKLFSRPVGWENLLRGMLYTNANLEPELVVETAAGKLIPSSRSSIQPTVVVYEMQERMEAEEKAPGVLVSCTAEPYLSDFAVVTSFALNCVCSPDIDLARRLTSGKKGLVLPLTEN